MKIVAFGGNGMVGSRVVELLKSDFEFTTPSEAEVDITNQKSLKKYLSKEKPQAVLNLAAITDVDACETERENKSGLVWSVNALAPKEISKLSQELSFLAIQISTDMVFSGNSGPYEESSDVGKYDELTWYGASKAEGEKGFLLENSQNAIVRIIYPVRNHFPEKLDYARKILKLHDEEKLYPMFVDQTMNVTYVDELAKTLDIILSNKIKGIYHVATSDVTNPFEFADYLILKARGRRNAVIKGYFKEFIQGKDLRRYPQLGGLISADSEATLGVKFSTWREVIDKLSSSLQTI